MNKTRVYRTFVAGSAETTLLADAAPATTAAAAVGALGVMNATTNLTVTAGQTVDDVESFYIIAKNAYGVKVSPLITGRNVKRWEGQSYLAEAGKAIAVDLGGFTTVTTVGSEVNFTIVFKSSYDPDVLPYRQYRKTYTVVAETSAEATANEYAARITDLINADLDIEVTASVVGDTVTITADTNTTLDASGQYPYQIDFDVVTEGIYIATSGQKISEPVGVITTTTAIAFGSGTTRQMRDLEDRQQGYLGKLNRTKFPGDILQYDAVVGGNYDLYVIEHDNVHEAGDFLTDISAPESTIIAIPAANTTLTPLFEAILNPYMASTPRGFAPVNN